MPHLCELTQQNVIAWCEDGYPTGDYPAIAEILNHAALPESSNLRFLRQVQLRALETYWYLRLAEAPPTSLISTSGTIPGPSTCWRRWGSTALCPHESAATRFRRLSYIEVGLAKRRGGA